MRGKWGNIGIGSAHLRAIHYFTAGSIPTWPTWGPSDEVEGVVRYMDVFCEAYFERGKATRAWKSNVSTQSPYLVCIFGLYIAVW